MKPPREVEERSRVISKELGMKAGRFFAPSILCLVLFFSLALAVAPTIVRAQEAGNDEGLPTAERNSDPDFSTIDDPLNGAYELYTVDDLLISRPTPLDSATKTQVDNYILETEGGTITSQSILTADTPNCWLSSGRQPQQTRAGRFFALGYDVIITLLPYGATASGSDCAVPEGEPNMALHIQTTQASVNNATPFTLSPVNTALVMDDFDQDGFEDLFIMSDTEVLVATARNLQDLNQGMSIGPATTLPTSDYATDFDPASGDFNSDGLIDVAWVGNDRTVHFATVCPGPVAGTICSEAATFEILLDPLKSQATPILNPGESGCTNRSALAAGQFDPTSYDGDGLLQFICTQIGTSQNPNNPITARWYQFEGDWSMTGGKPIAQEVVANTNDVSAGTPLAVFAQAGRLDWFGGSDQVAWALDWMQRCDFTVNLWQNRLFVGVLSFENNTITNQAIQTVHPEGGCIADSTKQPWLNGLAIGQFGEISDPTNASAYNQQIAVALNWINVGGAGGATPGKVRIYPLDSELKPGTPNIVTLNPDPRQKANLGDPQQTNWLVSGDLQGRSGRLGPPSIVRVSSHSQPSVVLGAPPMHVDYILPDASTSSDWEVVNFSAVPDTFNSSYTMSQTSTNQSSDTNRTSYTYATSEQGGGSFSFKLPHLPSIGSTLKTVSKQTYDSFSETYTYTQNEFKYDASTTTGFGDEIWYDVSSFNVYYYPVLGQTVCPANNGDCEASEEQPLYLTLSGPNSAGTGPGPGATTEWYQPVHEPGNVFSYPWDESQLALQLTEGLDLLTGPQQFYTDDSSQTQSLDWSSSTGSDQTAGTTNTHSYEKAYSLSGGKVIGEILNLNLSGNLDYNSSSSISTLNKSSSSIGASQGIAIAKPGTFLDVPLYEYRVEPYIFGRTTTVGTVDAVTLTQDIATTGPLQAAFAANPLDNEAGSWWNSDASPYTQDFDVALNHPVRWSISAPVGTQTTLNCLEAAGSRYNCLTFNDPNPNDLWNSEFYWMRGLFVTLYGTDGPQRTQATAGEDVVLQTRVYNYSFKDMPADAKIQVRFYRQGIQGTTPTGDSVLIDQVAIDPLPGFNSPNSPDTPNWTTATANLDTSALGDTYQIFWILVWVEDGAGNMIQELNGHGLSAKPGALTSIGDVPLEEVTVDGAQKSFSNNVGYLHSKFYIAPESAEPLTTSGALSIQNVAVTPPSVAAGERVIVGADILAGDAPADAIVVYLYPDAEAWRAHQNDPSLPQPRPFDVEMLPHIRADETDRLEVPYRAATCGAQEILIVARAAGQAEATTASVTFDNGSCDLFFPLISTGSGE